MPVTVRQACRLGALLGEGPLWFEGALWFVDIKRAQVHRYRPGGELSTWAAPDQVGWILHRPGGELSTWAAPDQVGWILHRPGGELSTWAAPDQVGWILPAEGNTMLAGVGRSVHRFDPVNGGFEPILAIEADQPGNRLNDACVDPAGRLWFGTMDDGERAPSGSVYRADARGLERVAGGIAVTNGPAISVRGERLYHCDSTRGLIHICSLDADGAFLDSRVFATVDTGREGNPDGPTVDAEDHLWVALNGGGLVRRYAPDGQVVADVRLPVTKPTKIAIGGPDGRTAYVTSASEGLSDAERATQPLAGDLLAFDAGVGGQPSYRVRALPPM